MILENAFPALVMTLLVCDLGESNTESMATPINAVATLKSPVSKLSFIKVTPDNYSTELCCSKFGAVDSGYYPVGSGEIAMSMRVTKEHHRNLSILI